MPASDTFCKRRVEIGSGKTGSRSDACGSSSSSSSSSSSDQCSLLLFPLLFFSSSSAVADRVWDRGAGRGCGDPNSELFACPLPPDEEDDGASKGSPEAEGLSGSNSSGTSHLLANICKLSISSKSIPLQPVSESSLKLLFAHAARAKLSPDRVTKVQSSLNTLTELLATADILLKSAFTVESRTRDVSTPLAHLHLVL